MSVLAYPDQHSSNAATQAVAIRTYADQVSYWPVSSPSTTAIPDVDVQNLGSEPISNVYLILSWDQVPATYSPNYPAYKALPKGVKTDLADARPDPIYLGTIPPCTVMTTNVLRLMSKLLQIALPLGI